MGESLRVDVSDTGVLLALNNGAKRAAYAIANALNATAKAAQRDMQAGVGSQFTLRRADFVRRQSAVISQSTGGGFASAKDGRLRAGIAVGEKRRLLLSAFERGGDRRAAMVSSGYQPRGKRAAVPITGGPARPSKGSQVPLAFTFTGLRFIKGKRPGPRAGRFVSDYKGSKRKSRRAASSWKQGDVAFARHTTAKGAEQWKGQHRTFILPRTRKAPGGGVFQRVGPGRDDIRMVYSFAGVLHLDHRLNFYRTMRSTTNKVFQSNLRREVNATLAFNKAR